MYTMDFFLRWIECETMSIIMSFLCCHKSFYLSCLDELHCLVNLS